MQLPKRKQNRLPDYDYATPNAYFITLCTQDRKYLFWENVGAIHDRPQSVKLTAVGKIVDRAIRDIPVKYPDLELVHYVVMPNHVHLLLRICGGEDRPVGDAAYAAGRSWIAPTISTVVQQTKGRTSREAGFPMWQKGFYDHVIRSDQDFREVWNYIEGNPGKWPEDRLRW